MKLVTATVPFFINIHNQQKVLRGKIYKDISLIYNKALNNKVYLYRPRGINEIHDSEYPDINDIIVAKTIGFHTYDSIPYLEIELYDTLYYSKLSNPVIRVNGYCNIENNIIDFYKPVRYTLTDKIIIL